MSNEVLNLFLAGLACTLRAVHQVPPDARSAEIFLQVLERTLNSRQMRNAPQTTIERVRAHQNELDAMLTDLRQMYADPTLLLLDPSDSTSH